MKIEYVAADSGEVLDVVTVPTHGPITYDTGAAEGQIRTIERVVSSRAELAAVLPGWTNGYIRMRAVAEA